MTPQEWIESTKRRWDSGHLYEGAQHLAAALEEIARLQAQLAQAERVVVPESSVIIPDSTDEDMESIAVMLAEVGGPHLCAEQDDFQAIARTAWVCCQAHAVDWLRAHSVPASRVLKDGEVAVTRTELGPLRVIANHFSRGDHEWILEYTVPVEMALDALNALRAQGKEGAT